MFLVVDCKQVSERNQNCIYLWLYKMIFGSEWIKTTIKQKQTFERLSHATLLLLITKIIELQNQQQRQHRERLYFSLLFSGINFNAITFWADFVMKHLFLQSLPELIFNYMWRIVCEDQQRLQWTVSHWMGITST